MTSGKDWRVDIFPLLFFTAVVGIKTYYVIGYIAETHALWEMMSDEQQRASLGGQIGFYLTGQFSFLAYYLTALAFDALVMYSFFVRRGAKQKPKGFWENIFPLITVFVPMIGLTLMFIPDLRQHLPAYPDSMLQALAGMSRDFPFYMNLSGALIGLFGAAFSIWAISHLRASFGLRAAVRELVTSGPYRRIRHPLYVGEIIHILGSVILAATPAALYLFVIAVALQVVRAKVEERKFLANVPQYAEFKRNTGFLWPKVF